MLCQQKLKSREVPLQPKKHHEEFADKTSPEHPGTRQEDVGPARYGMGEAYSSAVVDLVMGKSLVQNGHERWKEQKKF